jgi:hypothetical protein
LFGKEKNPMKIIEISIEEQFSNLIKKYKINKKYFKRVNKKHEDKIIKKVRTEYKDWYILNHEIRKKVQESHEIYIEMKNKMKKELKENEIHENEEMNELPLILLTNYYLKNKIETKKTSSKDFFHRLIENNTNEEKIIEIMNRKYILPINSSFYMV